MVVLQWDEGLNVGVDFMDADHADAARLINALADAQGDERVALLERFIDHCRHHFAREEELMAQSGFFALGCHKGEHQRVLIELEAVLDTLRSGGDIGAYFQKDLPQWLMIHRNTMDAVTAHHAVTSGYKG